MKNDFEIWHNYPQIQPKRRGRKTSKYPFDHMKKDNSTIIVRSHLPEAQSYANGGTPAQAAAYMWARKNGVKVRTQVNEAGDVIIQLAD